MPFYKKQDGQLVSAEFIDGPGYTLSEAGKDEHTYPVEGWYWFPNLDTAILSLADMSSEQQTVVGSKLDALWQAADKYTSSYISGVAIGLLTIGVLQQKPKALAVTNWSSTIWDEYYKRKALVTETSEDNLDFSSFGPMPFSVPELREELGL